MKRFYVIAYLLIMVSLFIVGCSSGNDYIFVKDLQETITEPKRVEADGTIIVTTESGFSFEAKETATFDENVSISIKEKEIIEPLSSDLGNASNLFSIYAEKIEQDSILGERRLTVSKVEKPVYITIPNNIKNDGTYYVGFRKKGTNNWHYSIINNENSFNNPLVVNSRFSYNNNKNVFIIKTYDLDLELALFIEEIYNPLSKAVVTDFSTFFEPLKIKTVDGRYDENLKVNVNVFGDNLSKLKPENCSIAISFFNQDSTEYTATTIPVTGATQHVSISEKDAGAGNSYIHTMSLSNFSDFSSYQFSFVLGLKGIEKNIFPATFSIKLKIDDSEDTLPHENTKVVELIEYESDEPFKPTEPEIRCLKVASIIPADKSEGVATNTPIVLTFDDDIEWSKADESKVTVSAASELLVCNYVYSDKKLTLTHNGLLPNRLYTVKIDEGLIAVASNTIVASDSFCFMTAVEVLPDFKLINIASTSPEDGSIGIATDSSSVITITFDAEVASDTVWGDYVILTHGSERLPLTFDYSEKVLTIRHDVLVNNSVYTVVIGGGMKGTEPNSETALKTFSFTTGEHEVTPVITGGALKLADERYYLVSGLEFTVDFNKPILSTDMARASIAMKKGYEAFTDFTVSEFPTKSRIATITVNSGLEPAKNYTIEIAEFVESDKSVVKKTSFGFSTLPDIVLNSVKIASDSELLDLKGRTDVTTSGRIIADFSFPVEPSSVKLVDAAGTEITEDVNVETTEKATSIELTYNNFKFATSYALSVTYTDSITGQKLATQTVEFTTLIPDFLVLENPTAENSPENPYLVYNAITLDCVRNDLTAHYKQMADIDLNGYVSDCCSENEGWAPIATNTAFSGSYNGNGYKISNMNINRSVSYIGLFGKVSGSLTGITLQEPILTASSYSGTLVGECQSGSRIKDCSVENGMMNSNGYYVGGLVGRTNNDTSIENSKVDLYFIRANSFLGGFVGYSTGTEFSDCSSLVKGTIDTSGGSDCGGFVGYAANSKLTDCNASANINAESYYGSNYRMGVLVGECYSTGLTNSHVTGKLYAGGDCYENYLGLLAGYVSGNSDITGCSAIGDVDGGYGYYSNYGVLIGAYSSTGTISNCTASGTVRSESSDVRGLGGLIGYCDNGNIENCNTTCYVSGYLYYYNESGAGGLIGYCNGSNINVTNCSSVSELSIYGGGRMGGLIGCYYSSGGSISACSAECKATCSDYDSRVGGLVGMLSNGNITDCSASGTILCEYDYNNCYGGGLVGENSGTISDSTAYGVVQRFYYAGGLAGANYGIVNNCSAYCSIEDSTYAGGLIAYNSTSNTVSGCLASGTFTGTNVGGLIAACDNGIISECEAFSEITTISGNVGGLIACASEYNFGCYTVEKCSVKTSIRGSNYSNVGGLIGKVIDVNVSECSADYDIQIGSGDSIGGLIGCIGEYYYGSGLIQKCSTKGSIIIENAYYIGGLIGRSGSIDMSECFTDCDIQTESGSNIGGLIGLEELSDFGVTSTIRDCYAKSSLNATTNNNTGGLIGSIYVSEESTMNMANSYSTCITNANGTNIGGLIGSLDVYYYEYDYGEGIQVMQGYFNLEKCFTTDITHSIVGIEESSDTRGTSYRSASGYNDSLAWDDTIWTDLDTATPKLINNPES